MCKIRVRTTTSTLALSHSLTFPFQRENIFCLLSSTLTAITVCLIYNGAALYRDTRTHADNLLIFFTLQISFIYTLFGRLHLCAFGVFLQNEDIIWLKIKLMIVFSPFSLLSPSRSVSHVKPP